MGEAARIAEVLGGRKVLGMEVTSVNDLVALIRSGLPRAVLHCLEVRTGLGRDILGKRATRSGHRLKPAESDRVMRAARVFVRAEVALGNPEKARLWFRRPNRALGMVEPRLLLDTDVGAQKIADTLGKIECGTSS